MFLSETGWVASTHNLEKLNSYRELRYKAHLSGECALVSVLQPIDL
jgi:hypothetical protein